MQSQKIVLEPKRHTWRFDPAYTTVEFCMRKLIFFTVRGRFKVVDGVLELDDAEVSNSSVNAAIRSDSIDTGNSKRDAHLRSKAFLQSETFPEIKFASSSVSRGKDRDSFNVAGQLSIKGLAKDIQLEVNAIDRSRAPSGEEFVYYSATTELDRYAFGITHGKGLIGRKLQVTINIQACRQLSNRA
jgi:polyisoprenoid-binding protein YceI